MFKKERKHLLIKLPEGCQATQNITTTYDSEHFLIDAELKCQQTKMHCEGFSNDGVYDEFLQGVGQVFQSVCKNCPNKQLEPKFKNTKAAIGVVSTYLKSHGRTPKS
jgi:hypothetical protein